MTRCLWLISPLNEALTLAPFRSGMVGRFTEAPNFVINTKGRAFRRQTTMSKDHWPALVDEANGSTPPVRNQVLDVTRFSKTAGHTGTRPRDRKRSRYNGRW